MPGMLDMNTLQSLLGLLGSAQGQQAGQQQQSPFGHRPFDEFALPGLKLPELAGGGGGNLQGSAGQDEINRPQQAAVNANPDANAAIPPEGVLPAPNPEADGPGGPVRWRDGLPPNTNPFMPMMGSGGGNLIGAAGAGADTPAPSPVPARTAGVPTGGGGGGVSPGGTPNTLLGSLFGKLGLSSSPTGGIPQGGGSLSGSKRTLNDALGLGTFGNFISDNPGIVNFLATGLGSGNWKQAMALAGPQFKEDRQRQASMRAGKALGLGNDVSDAMGNDPELARTLIALRLKPVDVPDLIKQYQYDVSDGYTGSFHQWLLEQKKAGAQTMTIDQRQQSAYAIKSSEGFVKVGEGIDSAAATAPTVLGRLSLMDNALNDPDVYTGFQAGNVALPLKRIISNLGFDPASAASMEVFKSQAANMVMDRVKSLGAGLSEGDRQFIVSTVPGLENSWQGNKALVLIARRSAERDIQIGQLKNQYLADQEKAHPDRVPELDYKWNQHLMDWTARNPVFPPEFQAQVQAVMRMPAPASRPVTTTGETVGRGTLRPAGP